MCGVWRGYDVAGIGGGEFAPQLVSRQRVAPLYWRSDTHTHTHTHTATPTTIASDSNDVSTTSVSEAGDAMMTSSSQKEGILKKNSILPKKDPPEGKITAIVAVMRGRPIPGHHRQRSNKHYKQKLVRVLLDSGSDSDLIFVEKDKPMLLFSSKKLVPQSWNTLNGMF
jgi:hypothetical protein